MRAVVTEDYGAAPVVRDVPDPVAGAGELLIRNAGSSINGFDRTVAAGWMQGRMEHHFPVILGRDFAGTVEAVGADVHDFSPGDRVFGVVTGRTLGPGGLAELVVAPAAVGVAHVPAGAEVVRMGAVGLAAITALVAVDTLEPVRGQTVLVAGAAGGVGSYAVQLLAMRGARVIATARGPEAAAFIRDLGAAEVLDHGHELAPQLLSLAPAGVDAAIHLAGNGVTLADLVRPGGRIASAVGLSQDKLGDRAVTVSPVFGGPSAAAFETIGGLIASGALRLPISRTYTLAEAPHALAEFKGPGKALILIG